MSPVLVIINRRAQVERLRASAEHRLKLASDVERDFNPATDDAAGAALLIRSLERAACQELARAYEIELRLEVLN